MVPFHENDNNASFRNPALALSSSSSSSSDNDSDGEDAKSSAPPSGKREESRLSSTDSSVSGDWRNLQIELERRKKVYSGSNVSVLPDKGARLKVAIEQLESTINNLKLNEEKQQESAKGNRAVREDGKLEERITGTETTEKERSVTVKEPSKVKTSPEAIPPLPSSKIPDAGKMQRENLLWNNSTMQFIGNTEMRTRIRNAMSELRKSLTSRPKEDCLEATPENLLISLLPHQRYALSWLLWRERQYPHGGILADDMGLGKTMTMISLILKQKESKLPERGATSAEQSRSTSSLVVCPASLIHHWSNEILNHCEDEAISVYIYHGPNRIRSIERLLEYDVVIVTYDTLCNEIKEKKSKSKSASPANKKMQGKSPLLCTTWERIILDEAHKIKNSKTMTARAVYALRAACRWAVTGTPIHNDLSDLYSLMKFLQFFPFDDSNLWKRYVEKNSDVFGNPINVLMNFILLRRMKNQTDEKGNRLVELPPKETLTVKLRLSDKERAVYDKYFKFCRLTVANFLQEQELKKNKDPMTSYSNKPENKTGDNARIQVNRPLILVMLLRLQQCCCHLSLLQKVAKYEIFSTDGEKEEEMFERMEALSLNRDSESADSKDASLSGLFRGSDDAFRTSAPSTKISAVLRELEKIRSRNKDGTMEKCVLVSQWVSMLEIVAEHIEKAGFRHGIIKGDVNVEARTKIVEDFNDNPRGAKILLLSLKAGGVGLNLVGGNHLFLLDIHWNPALENQARDRVYRLGQKKKVFVHKFICENTIEEKIVSLQNSKTNLANNVLSKTDKNRITPKDFYRLLQI